MGNCYWVLGQYEDAKSAYKKAIEKNPNNHFWRNQLAQCYIDLQDFDNAK
jgi:tetratricopeptide (TPR) repeat protein